MPACRNAPGRASIPLVPRGRRPDGNATVVALLLAIPAGSALLALGLRAGLPAPHGRGLVVVFAHAARPTLADVEEARAAADTEQSEALARLRQGGGLHSTTIGSRG